MPLISAFTLTINKGLVFIVLQTKCFIDEIGQENNYNWNMNQLAIVFHQQK